jgi:hypothetical protein
MRLTDAIIEINASKYDKQTKKAKRVCRGWSLKQRQRKGETKWETELDEYDTNSEDEKDNVEDEGQEETNIGRDATEEEEYTTNVEEEDVEENAEEEEEDTEEEVDHFLLGEKTSPYPFSNEEDEG